MTSYRVKGTTDETTTCECCGRAGLKKVVILAVLDLDGSEEAVTYFGTSCAAQAMGVRSTFVTNAAAAGDRKIVAGREWAAEALVELSAMPVREYIQRNRYYIGRPVAEAQASLDASIAEARKIVETGDITGSRFDR